MALNYKLKFCKITLASKLFVRNNYFPLFKILTPQDATKEIIKSSFKPKNHYMPVLHSHKKRERLSRGKKIKQLKNYGKRLHSRIDDFKYMTVCFNKTDDKHKKILELLQTKNTVAGCYVYKLEERNTCLVFNGQLEKAARDGDILDVIISDNANKMIMKLKSGEKVSTEAQDFTEDGLLFEGEAATSKETESKHHYGKMIMSIAHIFEMKERTAALYELEKLQFEAKKKQRIEREWKDGLEPLLANLFVEHARETEHARELFEIEKKEFPVTIVDMSKTSNVSQKLLNNANVIQKLPLIKEINRMIRHLGEGQYTEMVDMPGVILNVDDNERFVIGQMVQINEEKTFVPGQTFETTAGMKYIPGITLNLDNTPTFIAGVIMADENNAAVFLPGQTSINADGKLRLPKEGERYNPVGMKKLQMSEDEQWERVEKRRLAREKQEKGKLDIKHAEKSKADVKERKRLKKAKLDKKKVENAKSQKENDVTLELEKMECDDKSEARCEEKMECEIRNEVETQLTQSSELREDEKMMDEMETVRKNDNLGVCSDATGIAIAKLIPENTDMDSTNPAEYIPLEPVTESENLKHFNKQIIQGIFFEDHKHLIDANRIDLDREVMIAKGIKIQLEEDQKKNAVIAEDMKEVIESLEQKKTKLLEKLRNIQNETTVYEDKGVTYIYPAKANAMAVELGFEGQIARDIAKVLLGLTRWANTFSAKFHVHSENIESITYSSELDEEFKNCTDSLKSVMKAAMVAAVEIFKQRPQDLEAGLRAVGKVLGEAGQENPLLIHEIRSVLENKTDREKNVLFSSTLKDLTKKIVVNKAETLKSMIREEYEEEKIVAKMNLVIEEEGDILVRAFTNLCNECEGVVKKVYDNVIRTASELICEDNSGNVAHRIIVDVVKAMFDEKLNKFLSTEDDHAIKHLLWEGSTLANIVGMKNESKTLERLLKEEEVSVHVLATDQITLDMLRRVLVMRHLAERNPYLKTGMNIMRHDRQRASNDKNVRELVRESAALISHACPILSSMDIPSFLFELDNNLAMEDFLVQRIKKDGALLISKRGIQAVVPKEASRFVLSGLISYTLIDDKGITTFKPMHVFNALKLGKQKEKLYHEYSCVGAFDRTAYSVPIRESIEYNYRNYMAPGHDNMCKDDVRYVLFSDFI